MANEALDQQPVAQLPESVPRSTGRLRRWLLGGVLPLLVLAVGVTTAYSLLQTAPQAKRAPVPKQARLVEVVTVSPSTHVIQVEAMGTVLAARESTLYPQVAGNIVETSPELLPGGRFQTGDLVARIDDADYQLLVRQREATVAQARAALRQEQGQQANARAEYAMLGRKLPPEQETLVLRQPQLAAAQAGVRAAEATLEQARLDLERTRVTAPFAGMVVSRAADLGSRVSQTTPLLTLLDTKEFWVRASVPVDQLRWIEIPGSEGGEGSQVRVRNAAWPEGQYREGRVLRLAPDLDAQGRMARVLVSLPDPLALEPRHRDLPKVLLNDFLSLEIRGQTLDGVLELDRAWLRDGDRVWLLDGDERLEARPVRVLFRGPDTVLVDGGLVPDERLVTTDLAAPVPGMALRTPEADPDREQRP